MLKTFLVWKKNYATHATSAAWKINASLTHAQLQQVNDIADDNMAAF
jgi:hypothetical protein